MKNLILLRMLVVCVAVGSVPFAFAESPDKDAALDTIAQINHLNWVFNTIKTYNNALVLEEEYNKISPGHLNLNRIPDQEAMGRITSMLDLLHSLRMNERELKRWKESFDLTRRRRIREFYLKKGEEASRLAGSLCVNPLNFRAITEAAHDSVSGYFEYSSMIEDIEQEADAHMFKLDTQKLGNLHELNKSLLQDQWNMIRKYNFDDSLRVSDTDINLLISFLKDDDHERVYSRIEPMRDKFKLFPVYWYYLSSVAMETGHFDVGLEATEKFFKVNRNLFRDDFMLGAVAMNRAFMLEKTDKNKDEVRKLLDVSWKNNSGYGDWRRDYVLATLYAGYLDDKAMAEKVIVHAIASIESQLDELLSRVDGGLVDTVLGESLWLCRQFLEEVKGDKFKLDQERLKKICSDALTSSIEKLFYLGRMPASKLWDIMKDDIKAVKIESGSSVGLRGIKRRLDVVYPVNWLLAGGVTVSLVAYDGPKSFARFEENPNNRKVESRRLIRSGFEVSSDVLDKADSFAIVFGHKDYPVTLRFASRSAYVNSEKASVSGSLLTGAIDGKFATGKLCDDLALYVVFFGGKPYCRDFSDPNVVQFSKDIRSSDWVGSFAGVFPNITAKGPSVYVGRDGVESVELNEDGSCLIRYANNGEGSIRPKVSIFALNKFGAVVGRADDNWKVRKLKPGDSSETKIKRLADYNKIYYVDVETADK